MDIKGYLEQRQQRRDEKRKAEIEKINGSVKKAENVEEREDMRFVGLRTRIPNKTAADENKCRDFWHELDKDGTLEVLKGFAAEDNQYFAGLCSNFTSKGYDYWIAVEVDGDLPTPDGFESLSLPGGTYAYFECVGNAFTSVKEKWGFIYNSWFPKSGYNHTGGQEVELYPFGDMENDEYACKVLVPVRPYNPMPELKRRKSFTGSITFMLAGTVIGMLIGSAFIKDNNANSPLIWALIGGGVGYALYSYFQKRKENPDGENGDRPNP